MDFYFQLCSLEVNCESASVIAATLANGGICPLTDDQVITPSAVRDVLSLMHSCGMYDYSGQFAFHVGLPTKSGVSGCLMVVIPNLMGICCWSPPLDYYGNSVRGVQFCKLLVEHFNFHHYDNLRHAPDNKQDPRLHFHEHDCEHDNEHDKKHINEKRQREELCSVLFAAAAGDLTQVKRHFLAGFPMNLKDYDDRTMLHVAASEGHTEVVKFLVNVCKVNSAVKDRWGHTALDNAKQFHHKAVAEFLKSTSLFR